MHEYLDLEVSLLGVEPRIWRRLRVISEATFMNLHYAIQNAFGWKDCHLYEFLDATGKEGTLSPPYTAGQKRIVRCEHHDPYEDREDVPVADDIELRSYFPAEGKRCFYVYDFGDHWEHLVELKKTVDLPEEFTRELLDGARACPPEDCGGTMGYEQCCEAVNLSQAEIRKLDSYAKEEVESRLVWLDGWQPEAFDFEAVHKRSDL